MPELEEADPIQAIWDSVREGLITWDEARDLQAAIVAERAPIPIVQPETAPCTS